MEEKLEKLQKQYLNIEAELSQTTDPKKLKQLYKKRANLTPKNKIIEELLKLKKNHQESETALKTENDSEMIKLFKEEIKETEEKLEKLENELEILLLPPDINSGKNILIEIRAGTGGEEAALFVADLFRMYCKYADKKKMKAEIMSSSSTGIGGYKEIILLIEDENAYDIFRFESGTHRVQRIPTTESGGRIHTSAITVAVIPEAEEKEIDIQEKDLRIDVYRSSGSGGQHVNTTDSAVRITHIPTGIVVSCQDEKSQHKNKEKALRVLRSRVFEKQQTEEKKNANAIKKQMIGSGDRSERIRTYNFPQGRCTDHRVNYTIHNLLGILEGELDELLQYLTSKFREVQISEQKN